MSENRSPEGTQPRIADTMPGSKKGNRFAEIEYAEHAGRALRRLVGYFSTEKKLVLLMLLIVLVGTICGVYAPSMQSRAIDMISGSIQGSLAKTAVIMLAAYLIYSLSQLLQGLISARLSQNIVSRMRTQLFDKLMDLPIRYLDTHSHGDVMSRMTNDIENISTVISQALPSLFSGVLTIIGTAAAMLYYCPPLALLSFATILLTVAATKFLSDRVRRFSRRRQMLLGHLNGTVEEMIAGYRTVVAYNRQEQIIEDFCETADDLTSAGIRTDAFSGVMGPVSNCIGNIGFVIIAVMGGYFSVRGMISVGVISAFIVYAKQFSKPVNEIAQIYGQIQTAIAGAERIFVVLDEENENMEGIAIDAAPNTDALRHADPKQIASAQNIASHRTAAPAENAACNMLHRTNATSGAAADASVILENVSFSYIAGQEIIHDFSLTIPSGKSIALVGATGSGKTTIINLLERFYEIDSGRILIGGQDIRCIPRADLRRRIAIVLQDTVLFSSTVRENLSYGRPDAALPDLQHAAQMSRCDRLIEHLPQGYDTVLTGAGENISQGQRQLLAIARALAADPDILILDEATSNVDTRTEQQIQDALHTATAHRTSIIIAHRLSTIRDADRIIVMDHGQIAESGTHDELLQRKGRYYELYQTQFAGFAT